MSKTGVTLIICGILLMLIGWIAPSLPELLGAQYRETAIFLPLVLTVIRPVLILIGIAVLVGVTVLFGIPGWAPGDRKPDRETLGILVVIGGCIAIAALASIVWQALLW